MTITPFDNNLLRFLHFLVTNNKHMNSIQISKKFSINGKNVSDRTIRRWFLYLSNKQHFDYYPYINYNNIGLSTVFLVVSGLKNNKLLQTIPYNSFIFSGMDLKKVNSCLFIGYCIPYDNINNFKLFWKKAKQEKIIENYEFMTFSKVTAFFSPFHKIITENGVLQIPEEYKNKIDNSLYIRLLERSLEETSNIKIHKDVIKNPFIIPVMFRYFRENWSSRKVWHEIKTELGDNVWNYIKINKKKRKKKDGAGIKFVQETMKTLHIDFNDFFHQIRLTYGPFYEHNNFVSYIFLKLDNKKDIIKISDKISRCCISILVNQVKGNKYNLCIYTLTNANEFINILKIVDKYTNENNSKILLMDYNGSWKYWNDKNYLKLSPSLFDPNKRKWIYEHDKYMRTIRKIK